MRDLRFLWLIGLGVTMLVIAVPILLFTFDPPPAVSSPWQYVPDRTKPLTDHSTLLSGPFESGSAVTRACLTCHEDAARQVMQTAHWNWLGDPVQIAGREEPIRIGKANLINNFCIGIQSNWNSCTRCHAGYGWSDANFDFAEETNVDCLACHDQTGTYVKSNAGLPADGVDLTWVAQTVGRPTRQTCGSCHFNGGGGNGVKHGDLDESLYYPPESVDVHMGRFDFQCIDCHQTQDHNISGRAMSVSVDSANQIACTDCHDLGLHSNARITAHLDTVACQTCHIPAGARRDPTKMTWDWSQAGQEGRADDPHVYLKIKGAFIYESDFTPDYAWFNGSVSRYLYGDVINPEETTYINYPLGSIRDASARLFPFKVHHARQPYDTVYNILLPPHTAGEEGFWTTFNWDTALQIGAKAAGLPYSGQYDFAPTDMYWVQSHMVTPKEQALTCTDCHGENGRLNWLALGYPGDPMTWGGRTQ